MEGGACASGWISGGDPASEISQSISDPVEIKEMKERKGAGEREEGKRVSFGP